jgi:hypothetical protein
LAPRSARSTVICAVWHQDPRRHALLAGHAANLAQQTVPVEQIYVFDGGDRPPEGLAGTALVSPEPLTIYQAWNLALTAVRTPFVANLNLDDRLAPDALARLEGALDAGADLAGGDWEICFTQAATDDVRPCRPAAALPLRQGWPPKAIGGQRLGSTSPQRTMGPSCLWKMAVHDDLPRYPWRFDDGGPIRVIGDWLFWQALAKRGKKLQHVPYLIGNYHSHPGEQAEFREQGAGRAEHARAAERACEP